MELVPESSRAKELQETKALGRGGGEKTKMRESERQRGWREPRPEGITRRRVKVK